MLELMCIGKEQKMIHKHKHVYNNNHKFSFSLDSEHVQCPTVSDNATIKAAADNPFS